MENKLTFTRYINSDDYVEYLAEAAADILNTVDNPSKLNDYAISQSIRGTFNKEMEFTIDDTSVKIVQNDLAEYFQRFANVIKGQ